MGGGHGGTVDASMKQQLGQIFGFHNHHSDQDSHGSQDSDGSMWETEDEDGDSPDEDENSAGGGHDTEEAADHNVFIVPDDDDEEEGSEYIDSEMGMDEVRYAYLWCGDDFGGLQMLASAMCNTTTCTVAYHLYCIWWTHRTRRTTAETTVPTSR